jgi:ectoine hydroxylase-related dioxygenase (phytanoyl-CoA dioxygenase family)
MLTQEQIEFYHTNGYLAVENVLSADTIADLQRVTDEFIEKSRAVTQHTDVFDLEPSHTPENPRLRRLKSPAAQHPVYRAVMCDPRILDRVEQLIGPNLRQNGNKLNMKSPSYGSPVEWHQDWAFYPHTNDDLLAVGVCMDDMTLENGCLMVIPGSHTGPLYDHHQKGVFVGAVTDENFRPENVVSLELKAGGITIHHARTLHASALNRSGKARRLLLYQYCAADAFPLSGVTDLKKFDADLVRGQSTIVPRMANVPARLPLPNGERQGSIYEIQTMLEKPRFEKA